MEGLIYSLNKFADEVFEPVDGRQNLYARFVQSNDQVYRFLVSVRHRPLWANRQTRVVRGPFKKCD